MIRTKKQKIITLSIVFAAVLVLSIGFAVYSNSLYIKAKLSVNPNGSESYSVVFSKSATSVTTGSVTPTVTGEATAEEAAIDNSLNNPTLSTLNATFKSPGDSVTYTLYAYNNSTGITEPAYLTSINFLNAASGSTFKVCTAEDSANQESVDSACDSINVTVTVGSDSATNATQTITNHTLAVGASEKVTVTITYASDGAEADGAFTVEFGDISLYYSDGSTTSTSSGVLVDSNGNGEADIGEVVTLGDESFNVIETSNSVAYSEGNTNAVTLLSNRSNNAATYLADSTSGTVTLLAQKNITLSTTNPRQSDSAGTTYFSTKAYWANWIDGDWGYEWKDEYLGDSFVYDSNSNLYQYVEAYEDYLQNTVGISSASATLLSSNQALEILGIISSGECYLGDDDTGCGLYPWASTTHYWTGYVTAGTAWLGEVVIDGEEMDQAHYYEGRAGIRPVITINASDLSN